MKTVVYLALFYALVLHSSLMVQAQIITPTNCSCVAFRLDDIQDWWIGGVQRAVMNVFSGLNEPLTIGIIANYFGDDSVMLQHVKSAVKNTAWNLEVSCHGYNHEDFTNFTYAEQDNLFRESRTLIQDLLEITPDRLVTFIPPYNAFNDDTLNLLSINGYKYMSSEDDLDEGSHPLFGQTVYRFPTGAATSTAEGDDYVGVPYQETWAEVKTQIQNEGFSVIMLHPQDFAVNLGNDTFDDVENGTMLDGLRQLIATIKQAGLRIVPIREINVDAYLPVTTGAGDIITTGPQPVVTTSTPIVTTGAPIVTTGAVTTGAVTTVAVTTGAVAEVTTGSTTGETKSGTSSTTGSTRTTTTGTTGMVSPSINDVAVSSGAYLGGNTVIALIAVIVALLL